MLGDVCRQEYLQATLVQVTPQATKWPAFTNTMKRKFCFLRVIGHPYLTYDVEEELKRGVEPLIQEWVELDDDDPTYQYMMRPNDLVTGSRNDRIIVLELLEEQETANSTVTVKTLMEAAKAEVAKNKKRLEAAAARKKASEEKKVERLKKKYEKLKSVFEPITPDQKPSNSKS
jgi:hypothetical protein